MSQESQEQWKWSEMQGLELLTPSNSDSNSNSNSNPSINTQLPKQSPKQEQESVVEKREKMGENKDAGNGGEKAVPAVGFSELFRFADKLDYVLMAIGSIGAIVHGSSLPIFLRFFADLVNSFGSNANDLDKMMQEVLKVKQNKPISNLISFSLIKSILLLKFGDFFLNLQYAFYFLIVGAAIWASSWAGWFVTVNGLVPFFCGEKETQMFY